MRVGDLFSGCGGLSLGLQDAGFHLVVAVEHWAAARKVYSRNFDHPVLDVDIADVDHTISHLSPFELDMIVGGPPCQDFSAAGTRSEGERAQLTVSFAQIVAAIKPTWFLFENVPQAHSSLAWASAKRILRRSGYGISECTLNAAYFGVPQSRKRFFAIGRLGEDDHFLEADLGRKISSHPMTVRDHVGDAFGISYYYRHPRNWGRKAIFSIDEPSATIRSTNRPVPPGYEAHPTDAGPYKKARPLSASERAQIQTFPKTFEFLGTTTDQDMMIANAVPVALAAHVGSAVMRHELARASMPRNSRFRCWLSNHIGMSERGAGNVASRLRRVCKILKINRLTLPPSATVEQLQRRPSYRKLSTCVRSQLKRSIVLFDEYQKHSSGVLSQESAAQR